MNLELDITAKLSIDTTAYVHKGELKTQPCNLYEWYGNETCERLDINSAFEQSKLPDGKYKISIVIEKI